MAFNTRFGVFDDSLAKYIRATSIIDSDHSFIRKKANTITKDCSSMFQAVKAIHSFVGSMSIGFDYELLPASKILVLDRGQCNTKTTLFMALARAVKIPVRVHAWRVYKEVHKNNFPKIIYALTPKTTLFTYPEVYYNGKWRLLSEILTRKERPDYKKCPFDDGNNRRHPLKKEWIADDLGSFTHQDIVFNKFGTNTTGWRKVAFPIGKIILNKSVNK